MTPRIRRTLPAALAGALLSFAAAAGPDVDTDRHRDVTMGRAIASIPGLPPGETRGGGVGLTEHGGLLGIGAAVEAVVSKGVRARLTAATTERGGHTVGAGVSFGF